MATVKAGQSSDPPWNWLVLAMLAVCQYPVERVLSISQQLDEAGVLHAKNLAGWSVERMTRELAGAGYNRGLLTGMYAERLVGLKSVLESSGRATNEKILLRGEEDQVRQLLLAQYGIGPVVVVNFLEIRRAAGSNSRKPLS